MRAGGRKAGAITARHDIRPTRVGQKLRARAAEPAGRSFHKQRCARNSSRISPARIARALRPPGDALPGCRPLPAASARVRPHPDSRGGWPRSPPLAAAGASECARCPVPRGRPCAGGRLPPCVAPARDLAPSLISRPTAERNACPRAGPVASAQPHRLEALARVALPAPRPRRRARPRRASGRLGTRVGKTRAGLFVFAPKLFSIPWPLGLCREAARNFSRRMVEGAPAHALLLP